MRRLLCCFFAPQATTRAERFILSSARLQRSFFFCRRLIFRDLEFLPRRDMKRNFRSANDYTCGAFHIAVGSFSAFFILIY